MSSHTIKVTPTYFPGSKIEFVLSCIEENESKEEAKSSFLWSKNKFLLINSGLSDGWTKNSDYKELIMNTKIDNLSNKEILEHYASYISKFYSQNIWGNHIASNIVVELIIFRRRLRLQFEKVKKKDGR